MENKKLKTALIIGRWQPWHKGHRELFKEALNRAERVAIGVRATYATDEKNPFSFEEVKNFIDNDLKDEFKGKYEIIDLPNITNVIYGRDVGYKVEKITLDKEIEKVSATDVRKSMNISPTEHEVLPSERFQRNGHRGCVFWMTGLSASGKTTIAKRLERLLFDAGYNVFMLDGDNLRDGLNQNLSFSIEDRNENIRRASEVASLMSGIGYIVIASFITPTDKVRDIARKSSDNNFYEIFVSASLEECESRDPKGLYKRARLGEIKDFTGIDSIYETPKKPDLTIDTENLSEKESANLLKDFVLDNISLKI